MPLRIVMHEAFPPDDVEAARRIARDFDEFAEVSANYSTRAVEPVLVVLLFIGAQFGSGFFGKAGEDAWDALKDLVLRLRAELRSASPIVVEDDTGLQLVIGSEAGADLAPLPEDPQAAAGESGQLHWDNSNGWAPPY
jgi:hypothetical protein